MSQTINEQLSALLDGELPVAQEELLLRRLERDPELRDRLGRYGLVGDLLADSTVQPGALQLADRVRRALDGEAVQSTRDRIGAGSRAVGSGFVGAGLAAAVALVVALNLTPAEEGAQSPQFAVGAHIVADLEADLEGEDGAEDGEMHGHSVSVEPARLMRYLVSHAEYSNPATRQFVDSHMIMPSFRVAAWRPVGVGE